MGTGVVGSLGGYDVFVLVAMGGLALSRLALWQPGFEASAMVIPVASAIAILAVLAFAVPSAATVLGSVATVLALMLGFVSKLATLRGGESPSPFGRNGELRGFSNAGH